MNNNIINFLIKNKEIRQKKISYSVLIFSIIFLIIAIIMFVIYGWKGHVIIINFIEKIFENKNDSLGIAILFVEYSVFTSVTVCFFYSIVVSIIEEIKLLVKGKLTVKDCFNCLKASKNEISLIFFKGFFHCLVILFGTLSVVGFIQKEYRFALSFLVGTIIISIICSIFILFND